jgi:hypothetical protein
MTDEAALVRQRERNAAAFHVDHTGPPSPARPAAVTPGHPSGSTLPQPAGMSRRRSAALRLATRRGRRQRRGARGGRRREALAGGLRRACSRAPCRTLLSRLFRPPQPAARGGATPAPAALPRPSARSGTTGLYHFLATDWRDRQRITGVGGSMPKQSPLPRSPPALVLTTVN